MLRIRQSLPENILHGGLKASDLSEAEQRTLYSAEKGRDFSTQTPLDRETRIDRAMDAVHHQLERGHLVQELFETLQHSHLRQGETIHLIYPWRKQNDSSNPVPLVLADTLKDKLGAMVAADPKLNRLGLKFDTAPIYHVTKNSRKNLNHFERLVARSSFEPPTCTGKAFLVDDDVMTGMSTAEMYAALTANGHIDLLAAATLNVYDGGHRLRIHPAVRQALADSLRDNTAPPEAGNIGHFEKALKYFGYAKGLDSLTNMEALCLIASLDTPTVAMNHLRALWPAFNDGSLDQTNQRLINNGYEIWPHLNDALPLEQRLQHMLVQLANQPKLDLQKDGIAKMYELAEQRATTVEKTTELA